MAMNPALRAMVKHSAEKYRYDPDVCRDDDVCASDRLLLDHVMGQVQFNEYELERCEDVIHVAQRLVIGRSSLSEDQTATIRELIRMLRLSLGEISAASEAIGDFVDDLVPVEGNDLKAA